MVLIDLTHRPGLCANERLRVIDIILSCRLALLVGIKTEALCNDLCTSLHWITSDRHAVIDSRLELHAIEQPTLERSTGFL